MISGSVPKAAVQLSTVMDFVAMSLCGKTRPVCEPSNAAALGFFNKRSMQFDCQALRKAGIDPALLPDVCPAGQLSAIIAEYPCMFLLVTIRRPSWVLFRIKPRKFTSLSVPAARYQFILMIM